MSVAAALSSVIAPAGPAKGAGKTAGANATDDTAGAVQEIFGLAAGSTKGAAKAGDAKTGDNDDQASSPFADALAAALGVALQPILTQTAVATPKEASTSAVSRDGNAATVPAPAIGGSQTPTTNGTPTASASPTPSTTPTLVTTQAIVAAANDIKLADPKVVTQTPAFTANAPIAAPADADSAAIGATAPSPTPPIAAPADTDSAAIVATTPSPTAPVAAPTGPVSAVQTAQSSAAVTAPSALLVADPTVAPDQVALVPPVPAETAIQTAVAPPKAPLAPHVDKLTASSPPKSKAPASSPDAVKGPVAGVAPSKPDTVETLTDKAVAAVDNANPDAPATPDKVADPSALLANAGTPGHYRRFTKGHGSHRRPPGCADRQQCRRQEHPL
jgi:DNA polymerase-3 subunit gamma/tau